MRIVFLLVFFTAILNSGYSGAQEKTILRDSFSLKYPADWVIDSTDEDYDPDILFSIDSPDGGNMVMFIMMNAPIDPALMLEAQVKEFTKTLLKGAEISSFESWGRYKGSGKIMKGKILGAMEGYARVFVYTDQYKTMLVVEQGYDDDLPRLKKDYELVASSFSFR